MQVIMFSWEYPPRIVGKLADYVKSLASQVAKHQSKPYVVTYHDYISGENEGPDGVKVFWVTNPVHTHIGVLTWVLTLNQEVERVAANIYYEKKSQIDLIDVHDWHFIPAATTLKKALGIPFVYSVESLEDHRSHSANTPFNMAIKSIEWLGTYEAQELVVKSAWMGSEVTRLYQTPRDKVKEISPQSNGWVKEILKIYKDVTESRVVDG
jgi:glycogen(starch) synthase